MTPVDWSRRSDTLAETSPYPYFDPRSAPGYAEARIHTVPDMERERRYQSQNVRDVVPGPGVIGTKWSALPKIILKGCPHCGGTVDKEHPDFGYGDYSCVDCGRAWDVVKVTHTGVELGTVGHYLKREPPRGGKKRAKYDYD